MKWKNIDVGASCDNNCVYNPGAAPGYYWPGPHDVTADPDLDSTYHLQSGSPCIGKGDPTTDLALLCLFDADGHPRLSEGLTDMGAYECSVPCTVGIPTISPVTGSSLSPRISWSLTTPYSRYEVQLTDVTASSLVWDSGEMLGASPAQVPMLLSNGHTYSVIVRVGQDCGWGGGSAPVTFTINFTEPPLPTSVTYCQ